MCSIKESVVSVAFHVFKQNECNQPHPETPKTPTPPKPKTPQTLKESVLSVAFHVFKQNECNQPHPETPKTPKPPKPETQNPPNLKRKCPVCSIPCVQAKRMQSAPPRNPENPETPKTRNPKVQILNSMPTKRAREVCACTSDLAQVRACTSDLGMRKWLNLRMCKWQSGQHLSYLLSIYKS